MFDELCIKASELAVKISDVKKKVEAMPPGPDAPIKKIEGRTREQLMQRMLAEARFQMGLLGTMISWAENQEWARRKGR